MQKNCGVDLNLLNKFDLADVTNVRNNLNDISSIQPVMNGEINNEYEEEEYEEERLYSKENETESVYEVSDIGGGCG